MSYYLSALWILCAIKTRSRMAETQGQEMSAITFDALKFANRLKSTGVPDKQAEAEAEVLAEALEVNLKDLSTKADFLAAKVELQQDATRLQHHLDR